MTDNDILKLAIQCQLLPANATKEHLFAESIVNFGGLIAAIEREECAKVCDELVELNRVDETESMWPWEKCAAAIRNRSGT